MRQGSSSPTKPFHAISCMLCVCERQWLLPVRKFQTNVNRVWYSIGTVLQQHQTSPKYNFQHSSVTSKTKGFVQIQTITELFNKKTAQTEKRTKQPSCIQTGTHTSRQYTQLETTAINQSRLIRWYNLRELLLDSQCKDCHTASTRSQSSVGWRKDTQVSWDQCFIQCHDATYIQGSLLEQAEEDNWTRTGRPRFTSKQQLHWGMQVWVGSQVGR